MPSACEPTACRASPIQVQVGALCSRRAVTPRRPRCATRKAKCQQLLPGGGVPGTSTHPTAAALAEMLKVTQCMRRHGIYDFPDPTTSMPKIMPSGGDVSDRDGVILVFPPGLDTASPQFTKAAAACELPLTNH